MELDLAAQAGWLLLAAAAISVLYELWRATARAAVSAHDSIGAWVRGLPVYVLAFAAAVLLIVGWEWATVPGLVLAGGAMLLSTFWYGPSVLPARRPNALDWLEDRAFTMLVAVVFALLAYDLAGLSLRA